MLCIGYTMLQIAFRPRLKTKDLFLLKFSRFTPRMNKQRFFFLTVFPSSTCIPILTCLQHSRFTSLISCFQTNLICKQSTILECEEFEVSVIGFSHLGDEDQILVNTVVNQLEENCQSSEVLGPFGSDKVS